MGLEYKLMYKLMPFTTSRERYYSLKMWLYLKAYIWSLTSIERRGSKFLVPLLRGLFNYKKNFVSQRKKKGREKGASCSGQNPDDQPGAIGSSPDSSTNEFMTVTQHLIFLGPSSLIY